MSSPAMFAPAMLVTVCTLSHIQIGYIATAFNDIMKDV